MFLANYTQTPKNCGFKLLGFQNWQQLNSAFFWGAQYVYLVAVIMAKAKSWMLYKIIFFYNCSFED
jgi:hypothetical protein